MLATDEAGRGVVCSYMARRNITIIDCLATRKFKARIARLFELGRDSRVRLLVCMAAALIVHGAFACAPVSAQWVCSLGTPLQGQYSPYWDRPPAPRAVGELQRIYRLLCPMGCGQFSVFENPTVANAMAQAVAPGATKISYSPDFMNRIVQTYGPGATFGILAHELGHHIDFHVMPPWMSDAWSKELKADAWAGCALARAGMGTSQMQSALRVIALYPSMTHPPWQYRHDAVRTGYINCGGAQARWRDSVPQLR